MTEVWRGHGGFVNQKHPECLRAAVTARRPGRKENAVRALALRS